MPTIEEGDQLYILSGSMFHTREDEWGGEGLEVGGAGVELEPGSGESFRRK